MEIFATLGVCKSPIYMEEVAPSSFPGKPAPWFPKRCRRSDSSFFRTQAQQILRGAMRVESAVGAMNGTLADGKSNSKGTLYTRNQLEFGNRPRNST